MFTSLLFVVALFGVAPEPETAPPAAKGGALCVEARLSPALRARGAAVRCAPLRQTESKSRR